MEIDIRKTIEEFVDYLMPDLSPHEASMYIFLFRNSYLNDSSASVRLGQRTIAQRYGKGPKMSVPSRQHVIRQLDTLEQKGCIRIGDTNRQGTLYDVFLPSEIPLVIEKLAVPETVENDDFYHDPVKRENVYERDQWICQYCGEKVTSVNATLDHFIPQSNGGTHKKENLRTACLMCNSVKSGKSYEEAALQLLQSIQERRSRSSQA
jgi:hypothetical protein